jgi:GTP cyclohydrolase I
MSGQSQEAEILFAEFMRKIGLDPDTDPSLKDTPVRFTKMLCEAVRHYKREPKFTTGSHYDPNKEIKATLFDSDGTDELVIVKDIDVVSLCGHHFAPFFGVIHIGYLPAKKIIGLSKLARIADYYCARPQTQEYLTEQIAHCLMELTKARFVGVIMQATHTCVSCRGPKKIGATTITSKYLPTSMTETKAEFLKLVL